MHGQLGGGKGVAQGHSATLKCEPIQLNAIRIDDP